MSSIIDRFEISKTHERAIIAYYSDKYGRGPAEISFYNNSSIIVENFYPVRAGEKPILHSKTSFFRSRKPQSGLEPDQIIYVLNDERVYTTPNQVKSEKRIRANEGYIPEDRRKKVISPDSQTVINEEVFSEVYERHFEVNYKNDHQFSDIKTFYGEFVLEDKRYVTRANDKKVYFSIKNGSRHLTADDIERKAEKASYYFAYKNDGIKDVTDVIGSYDSVMPLYSDILVLVKPKILKDHKQVLNDTFRRELNDVSIVDQSPLKYLLYDNKRDEEEKNIWSKFQDFKKSLTENEVYCEKPKSTAEQAFKNAIDIYESRLVDRSKRSASQKVDVMTKNI